MKRVRDMLKLEQFRALRYKKQNFSIAVLDSGVSLHPDIKSQIGGFYDITGKISAQYDDYGHGTHIGGIIAGNGKLSNGLYEGIVPGANLVCVKILEKDGSCTIKNLLKGFEWILRNKEKYNIRLVNISVGLNRGVQSPDREEIQRLITEMAKSNILVITAAGNDGPAPMTLSGLGESDQVIAVGCYDYGYRGKNGRCCETYSSRGPSLYSLKKPDIVAPGTEIVSCSHRYLKGKSSYYCAKSGTSMATAVVAGIAALYLSNRECTAQELQYKLQHTAKDLKEPWNKQGWGLIDAERLMHKVDDNILMR